MSGVMSALRRINQFGLWFGGALILSAALIVGVDVLMRKFLDRSMGGADELSGYALAIGTTWGLGATLLDRAHIRIDSLYVLFPNRLRLALDLVGILLFLGFFGMIGWHGLGVVAQSWTSGSRSQSALETPTVIPQFLWIAGLGLFVVTAALLLLQALVFATRGETQAMAQIVSTRSAEEEVEDEIRDLKQRQAREGS